MLGFGGTCTSGKGGYMSLGEEEDDSDATLAARGVGQSGRADGSPAATAGKAAEDAMAGDDDGGENAMEVEAAVAAHASPGVLARQLWPYCFLPRTLTVAWRSNVDSDQKKIYYISVPHDVRWTSLL